MVGEFSSDTDGEKMIPEKGRQSATVLERLIQTHVNVVISQRKLFEQWVANGGEGGYRGMLNERPLDHAAAKALADSFSRENGFLPWALRDRIAEIWIEESKKGSEGTTPLAVPIERPDFRELIEDAVRTSVFTKDEKNGGQGRPALRSVDTSYSPEDIAKDAIKRIEDHFEAKLGPKTKEAIKELSQEIYMGNGLDHEMLSVYFAIRFKIIDLMRTGEGGEETYRARVNAMNIDDRTAGIIDKLRRKQIAVKNHLDGWEIFEEVLTDEDVVDIVQKLDREEIRKDAAQAREKY